MKTIWSVLFCGLWLAAAGMLPAQEATNSPSNELELTIQSLDALFKSIQNKSGEVKRIQAELQAAPDELTKKEVLARLGDAKAQLTKLSRQFEEFSAQVDLRLFEKEEETGFDWQVKLSELLEPIVTEFENATAESRAIGELRTRLQDVQARREVSEKAVENLKTLIEGTPEGVLRTQLHERLKVWNRRFDTASNEETALDLQLKNKLEARRSLLESSTGYAQNFFKTRGLNLAFGVGAFFGVFFLVRLIYALYRRRKRAKNKSFSNRLAALLFEVFSVVGGFMAMLMVFNMVGDWFLLGIILIFLLGVGWASINTLPQHMETVKLILNIGGVREDERIVMDGVPWKVDSLGLQAQLVNPLLDGGVLRLPVKYLVGLHSRPPGENEEWFPSRQGDWVELADGRVGRVSYQTPSTVEVVELGGSQVVYPTGGYMELNPRNMSTNFRIRTTFGVDYAHLDEATTAMPDAMGQALEAGLGKAFGEEAIKHVAVQFAEAGASSLDLEAEVDVDGTAAQQYENIRRAMQRILVDVCRERGWGIPFQQIVIHRAD